jgi:hypothetical protein
MTNPSPSVDLRQLAVLVAFMLGLIWTLKYILWLGGVVPYCA